jgi:CDP-paratose 2-epimerase
MNILITGGAGFVGSYLAIQLKEVYPNAQVVALDNLKRRGSELQLAKLKRHGVEFIHGDIRDANDFDALRDRTWDYLIECSAEPSVHAGSQGYGSHYLIHTNFLGTFNSHEL